MMSYQNDPDICDDIDDVTFKDTIFEKYTTICEPPVTTIHNDEVPRLHIHNFSVRPSYSRFGSESISSKNRAMPHCSPPSDTKASSDPAEYIHRHFLVSRAYWLNYISRLCWHWLSLPNYYHNDARMAKRLEYLGQADNCFTSEYSQ